MATSVCSALGIDQENSVGKLIAVEEHHSSNGNFVLNCLIAEQVHKEGSVCLVALHNSFGHYHNVGTKLGYNLHQLQEKGCVESIEVLKLLNESLNAEHENRVGNVLFGDEENTMRNLFHLIKGKTEKLLQKRKLVSLVIDDLSNLLSLGISVKEVLSFLQYCRTLLESQPGLSLVVLTHIAEGDDEQQLLNAGLCHVADVIVTVCGLKTGQSSDVSGSMKVTHRRLDQPMIAHEWNKQNLYHFKLLDRQVKVFAPGTATCLI
ncbi:Elongator complex protein 6 [Cryptotermes secundus]|uniref:Elongator complex protein 6 n=2 Tax=Cryptotermes secundus TaxID=105785 RepID=A0A2J7QAD5_9NEOP|nr:Elongator complex protein 6 [Cryptotermes secundus]